MFLILKTKKRKIHFLHPQNNSFLSFLHTPKHFIFIQQLSKMGNSRSRIFEYGRVETSCNDIELIGTKHDVKDDDKEKFPQRVKDIVLKVVIKGSFIRTLPTEEVTNVLVISRPFGERTIRPFCVDVWVQAHDDEGNEDSVSFQTSLFNEDVSMVRSSRNRFTFTFKGLVNTIPFTQQTSNVRFTVNEKIAISSNLYTICEAEGEAICMLGGFTRIVSTRDCTIIERKTSPLGIWENACVISDRGFEIYGKMTCGL